MWIKAFDFFFVSLSLLQLICCLVLQPCLSLLQKNCPNYFPGKFIIIFPPRLQKMLDHRLFRGLVLCSICYMPCSLFDMSSDGKLKVLGLLLVNAQSSKLNNQVYIFYSCKGGVHTFLTTVFAKTLRSLVAAPMECEFSLFELKQRYRLSLLKNFCNYLHWVNLCLYWSSTHSRKLLQLEQDCWSGSS